MLLISFPLVLVVNLGRATDERRRNGVELHRFLSFVRFSFLLVLFSTVRLFLVVGCFLGKGLVSLLNMSVFFFFLFQNISVLRNLHVDIFSLD
jgi:hypothetical protein